MRFLQNHKENYGALCKSKTSTSLEQIFCQLQKALLLYIQTFFDISDFFPKSFFLGGTTFLFIRNQKFVWNFIKILSAFFEKKWFRLTDWLAVVLWVFLLEDAGGFPPPAQSLLIPPPPRNPSPPVDSPHQILISPPHPPAPKVNFFSPLNSNVQVTTQSKQHF